MPSHPQEFTYKHLSVGDEEDEDLVAVFKEAFDFIDEGRKSGGHSEGQLAQRQSKERQQQYTLSAAPGCQQLQAQLTSVLETSSALLAIQRDVIHMVVYCASVTRQPLSQGGSSCPGGSSASILQEAC